MLRFWLILQVTAGEEKKREEVDPDPPVDEFFLVAVRGFTRRQWWWRVQGRAATVPACRRASLQFLEF